MPVSLTFSNNTAGSNVTLHVRRSDCEPIARWYGAFHAGDQYDVFIDSVLQTKDIDGLLASDPDNRL